MWAILMCVSVCDVVVWQLYSLVCGGGGVCVWTCVYVFVPVR